MSYIYGTCASKSWTHLIALGAGAKATANKASGPDGGMGQEWDKEKFKK